MNFIKFYAGQEWEAYRFLGAHFQGERAVFRVFAPSAQGLSVIGSFNGWQDTPMKRIYDGNFWECVIPEAKRGDLYKFRIYQQDGRAVDHCDPFAQYSELRPGTASVLWDLEPWEEETPFRCHGGAGDPVNIYELHAGSWKKPEEGFFTYRELADQLVPYLAERGYNFLELLPLCEHPCDQSWGYQATGYFSPTSRYGTPQDLRALIQACHRAGIGVLLDFVPVHFAVNDYALWRFDGTSLFEYPHSAVGYSEWGSCNFMHSRGEVRSFLLSAAHYWMKEFHFDGLRIDAVRNLLYWQGDEGRGVNQSGVQFLKDLNRGLKERFPQAVLVAEDSSQYPGVTAPVDQGGLGFTYKWDLGWMHDTLSFFQAPPQERLAHPEKLTFSLHYFYKERYLLPLSHDEVVHGKATILQKMNGDSQEDKFAQVRLLYLAMFAHPGKKLNFMGNELGMFREWDESRPLDWELLSYPRHDALFHYLTELHQLYLAHDALFAWDYRPEGFQWLALGDRVPGAFAFLRRSSQETLLAALNASPEKVSLSLELPEGSQVTPLLSSAWQRFGGPCPPEQTPQTAGKTGITLSLPRYAGCLYRVRAEGL